MSTETVLCQESDLIENSGVCALVNGEQVALFDLPQTEEKVFAISNWDPIGKANVLSRGIVGDLGGSIVVASPLYKQHFDLKTGSCLEDEEATVKTFGVTLNDGKVLLS